MKAKLMFGLQLQEKQLINYGRGQVTIVDRNGLVTAACECYRIIKDSARRSS